MATENALARALTLIAPVVVASLTVLALAFAEPEKGADGAVLNGQRLELGAVETIETRMIRHDPQVVVLGNSLAHTNLDATLVASKLGLSPQSVQVFALPNSVVTHWYAILKNRIYGNDLDAPVVVVVAGLRSMLISQPYSEESHESLEEQLGDEESVIDRHVRRSPEFVARLARGRSSVRDSTLDWMTNQSIGLFFREPGAQRHTDAAMERVFHHSNTDHGRHRSAMPVLEARAGFEDLADAALPTLEQSLLEDFARLGAARGSRMVFIRPPVASRADQGRSDYVQPLVVDQTHLRLEELGHDFIDLSDMAVLPSDFKNLQHMTPQGATRLTRRVMPSLQTAFSEADP